MSTATPQVRPRLARVATWTPSHAAAWTVAAGAFVHEVVYHLTGGGDFPLQVLANGTCVFAVSHGGLDSIGVGALVVGILALIESAQMREARR